MKKELGMLIKQLPPLYRSVNRVRGYRLHDPTKKISFEVLGSAYGGWALPTGLLNRDSIVYSVGIGEDITFDLSVARLFGSQLFLFDPTPIALEFMAGIVLPDNIAYVPIGLAEKDGVMQFSLPGQEGFHSFRRADANSEPQANVACQVLTFTSLKRVLGHDCVDVLKMDIEGSEYSVLEEITSSGELPKCLLVEFHHKSYGYGAAPTKTAVEKLKKIGYECFWISDLGREYGFLRREFC
ncbi:MAG: FkbM family methyltransferase [Candidatus Binataceae bacterium]